MEWMRRVTSMGVVAKDDDDDKGRKGSYKALEHADVLWAAWSDDGQTPSIRVIRGRGLTGEDLKHGVLLVDDETAAIEFAESYGDEIGFLADGKTLDVPEPAVPQPLIDAVMSDRVLLFDGTEMSFHEKEEEKADA